MGSSPLTRGARPLVYTVVTLPGLIPAHAGSTKPGLGNWFEPRAHPRSRGEHDVTFWGKKGENGSSPLTRGALKSVIVVS